MTSHHDVAAEALLLAKVLRSRERSNSLHDIYRAAELLESQAKVLSEAETAYDGLMKAKETFRAEAHRNAARALAAEASLAEAMRLLVLYGHPEAARDFLNAAKEKT